jgi:hypothetical protein
LSRSSARANPPQADDPDTRALIRLLEAAGSGNDPDAELARLLPAVDFEDREEVMAILRHLGTNADTNQG